MGYEELVKRLRTFNGWALNETLKEAADAIEVLNKPKWIPASEPPDEWGDFLCWYEYFNWNKEEMTQSFGLGYWNADDKCWGGEAATGKNARVLAYMPLPEPPEWASV